MSKNDVFVAPSPWMSSTSGPSPSVSVDTLHPRAVDVVDAERRRAVVGQAEEALEADGEVEVAAGVEPRGPRRPRCR